MQMLSGSLRLKCGRWTGLLSYSKHANLVDYVILTWRRVGFIQKYKHSPEIPAQLNRMKRTQTKLHRSQHVDDRREVNFHPKIGANLDKNLIYNQ